ncbi:MAG TPA: hypothetical protein VLZ83_10945 [Edaphocola sp.]|nr:hypothetical protein [Edaphocola sp.]
MKLILIILHLIFFAFYVNAQENKDVNNNIILNSGGHSNVLIYLNCSIFEKELYDIDPDTIGAIFAEGDSSYVSRTYGDSPDTSLIRQYFGEQRDRGVLFIFTKDKIQPLPPKKLRQYIKDERCKVVFKVDNSPLTNNRIELDPNQIDKIQMVKDFKLTKWDTGDEDVFILFVIKTKR